MNHYEELGIPPDSNDRDIKRAYRRAAQSSHPDRPGGSTEKFQKVQLAYEVLSDQTRRSRYDRTGESVQPDALQQAQLRVISILFSAIDNLDEENTNIIEAIRTYVQKEERADLEAIGELMKKIAKRERAFRRLRAKRGKPNLLAHALEMDIADKKRRIEIGKESLQHHKDVYKLLDDYEYTLDLVLYRVRELRFTPTSWLK